MTAQTVAHDRWCDGYGACHSARVERHPDITSLYLAWCPACMFVTPLSESETTARGLFSQMHPSETLNTFDVCGCV